MSNKERFFVTEKQNTTQQGANQHININYNNTQHVETPKKDTQNNDSVMNHRKDTQHDNNQYNEIYTMALFTTAFSLEIHSVRIGQC